MTYAENILRVYDRTDDATLAEGMVWYNKAHAFALELSPGNPWRGAGVIAVLSVQKDWKQNVILARRAFDTGIVSGTFGTMCAQGQRILDGEFTLDVLNGDKVRAFASAIALNGLSDIATIDRHAHDVAMGRVFRNDERKIGRVLYRTMSSHYVQAALEIGIHTQQLQAAVWCQWKKEKGHK